MLGCQKVLVSCDVKFLEPWNAKVIVKHFIDDNVDVIPEKPEEQSKTVEGVCQKDPKSNRGNDGGGAAVNNAAGGKAADTPVNNIKGLNYHEDEALRKSRRIPKPLF